MKLFLTFIGALFFSTGYGQWLPDADLYRVRITTPEQTQVFETIPVNKRPHLASGKIYHWYSANHIHATQGGYSGKLLNGKYDEYYVNKSLKQQGKFKKGLKDGEWRRWDEQGKLQEVISWRKGEQSGPFELYDDQGKVKQSGTYKNGLLNGEVLNYSGTGSVERINYKNGLVKPRKIPFWKRLHLFKKKVKNQAAN